MAWSALGVGYCEYFIETKGPCATSEWLVFAWTYKGWCFTTVHKCADRLWINYCLLGRLIRPSGGRCTEKCHMAESCVRHQCILGVERFSWQLGDSAGSWAILQKSVQSCIYSAKYMYMYMRHVYWPWLYACKFAKRCPSVWYALCCMLMRKMSTEQKPCSSVWKFLGTT